MQAWKRCIACTKVTVFTMACSTLVLVLLNTAVGLGITLKIFANQEAPINANDLAAMFSQAIHVLAFFVLLCCFIYFKRLIRMIPKLCTCPNNFPLIVIIIIFFAIPYIVVTITPPLVFAIWIDHNQTSKLSYSFTAWDDISDSYSQWNH